jgi:tetratricopeptide (TPR) repeat protein
VSSGDASLNERSHRFGVVAALIALAAVSAGCAGGSRVDAYNDYAISAARHRLWGEAALRWEQALELDDADDRIWNNLGVAYEADERFGEAVRAYSEAVEMDPENSHYIRNLRRCERNRDRTASIGDAPEFDDENDVDPSKADDAIEDEFRDGLDGSDDDFRRPRNGR